MAKKKQVGNVTLGPKSISNNTQELRMMPPSQVYSLFTAWSYHSNWSDNISPPQIIPPLPPNGH